ncbi:MAG: hypothetical protein AB2614_19490 [Candidatus Thiodiazotropha endolucinida]|nr:hypothetical protein [Candidatus Thiodiazotropha endolucinida]MCW4246789.1 hypothetical protein [Candidatus Thiodiazotropha endolucinida]MCW4299778.1 hypothetical protein [Candidatus Thiodiazotropha endolucinida]MCW4309337.1 hypothetical protein [Candidatus Thiodiazotropha endolucinida]MCW4335263.1 hypothetical protein [Candidatus Thiodiazotropha endolucinida]
MIIDKLIQNTEFNLKQSVIMLAGVLGMLLALPVLANGGADAGIE